MYKNGFVEHGKGEKVEVKECRGFLITYPHNKA